MTVRRNGIEVATVVHGGAVRDRYGARETSDEFQNDMQVVLSTVKLGCLLHNAACLLKT